jgi:dihydrofolate reductase
MRKIRIMEHVSMDGVISPPGDSDFAQGGWSAPYRTPAGAAALVEAQGTSFDLLLGRRTYDLWADFWPKVTLVMKNSGPPGNLALHKRVDLRSSRSPSPTFACRSRIGRKSAIIAPSIPRPATVPR